MKKLLVGLTSVATIALMAGPVALAHGGPMMGGSDILVVNDNDAKVTNNVNVSASTGDNKIVAVKGGGNSGDISTGDATAFSTVENYVNDNTTKVSASCRRGCTADIKVINKNDARVRNTVDVSASTGGNGIVAVKGGGNSGDIRTGDAYADSLVVNVVNTNVTRIRR